MCTVQHCKRDERDGRMGVREMGEWGEGGGSVGGCEQMGSARAAGFGTCRLVSAVGAEWMSLWAYGSHSQGMGL